MDGKTFLHRTTSPKFTFDLQRFTGYTVTQDETTNKWVVNNGTEKIGEFDTDTAAITSIEAKFSVTADGITKYYNADGDFNVTNLNATGVTEINLLGNLTLQDNVGNAAVADDPDTAEDESVAATAITTTINVAKSVTLDLNGKTLYTSAPTGIQIADGTSAAKNTFTLRDSGSGGKIISTWNPSEDVKFPDLTGVSDDDIRNAASDSTAETINNQIYDKYIAKIKGNRVKAAINVGTAYEGSLSETSFKNNQGYAKFIMEGGTIESKTTGICISDHSDVSIQDGCTVASSKSCGVYFGDKGNGGSSLTMTGGSITSGTSDEKVARQENSNMPAIQVSGNYNSKVTTLETIKIDISGGTLAFNNPNPLPNKKKVYAGNNNAIYAGNGVILNISGGTITSTVTGIEFRGGELNVTGGTITSTAKEYSTAEASSGSGATTFGAAIAMAQQSGTSAQKVTVNISGSGTNLSGPNALAVANPKQNADDANKTLSATIDGGNFKSTQSTSDKKTGNAILADNANVFITVNDGNLDGNVTVAKTEEIPDVYQEATVVVAGGHTTGSVQVVKTDSTGKTEEISKDDEDYAKNKTALKVMGGKVDTVTKSTSNYLAAGQDIDESGNITESSANGWSLESDGKYRYVLSGSTIPLVTVDSSAASSAFVYEKNNRLLGIPYVANDKWDWGDPSGDLQKGYYLAQRNVDGNAVSIKPETAGVRITGTTFIGNAISLTAEATAPSLGAYVDAADNSLAYIVGSEGNDTFKAGKRDSTLDGGAGNDVLEGNTGRDLFLYSSGNDGIRNYTYGTDIVSVTGDDAPPISFGNDVKFDGANFAISLGSDNVLTFNGKAEIELNYGRDVYYYKGNSAGIEQMQFNASNAEKSGVSLGAGYAPRNGKYDGSELDYRTIDARRVVLDGGLTITGNDNASSLFGAGSGGSVKGGTADDTIVAGGGKTTLNGGEGDDKLEGSSDGINTFAYTEGGADSIYGYETGDVVTVSARNYNPTTATFIAEGNNISLDYGGNDKLVFVGNGKPFTRDNAISLKSGSHDFLYTKDFYTYDNKAITFVGGYSVAFDGADSLNSGYETINAAAAGAMSIVGNGNDNYIFGSNDKGGSLYGGAGNDRLILAEDDGRASDAKGFVLKYTEGKDSVIGFDETKDLFETDATQIAQISNAKAGRNRLAFTFDKKANVMTFRSDDDVSLVSLQGDAGRYLTKDGYVAGKAFSLFGSARGEINLTGDPYSAASINAVDAHNATSKSITLVAGEQGGDFIFATNKKKDLFEYGGGSVAITNYETSKDKINLGDFAITDFKIDGTAVSLKVGDSVVSIAGAAKHEVLIHDADSRRNSYTKKVYWADGVVTNKEKRPTFATLSAGIGTSFSASSISSASLKKIFVSEGVKGASIAAGSSKTTLDASAAGGVTLIGGAKNDKLIGSKDATDAFFYEAGKDVIQNYVSGEQISLTATGKNAFDLEEARINVGKKSIKFKFSSKNALTIKSDATISSVKINNNSGYTYSKNAIVNSNQATLTSQFSGTYKVASGVNQVDGDKVAKNLIYKGTSDAETLTGGTKKTTFKGGGGNDNFVGGSGKDVLFYAKGNAGTITAANFDFANDKVKIASGTLSKISTVSGGVQFAMSSGKKNDTAQIGWLNVTSQASYNSKGENTLTSSAANIDPNKVLIKANNTYFWFADNDTASKTDGVSVGSLITADSKVSKSDATKTGYGIIDLGYSTNLFKTGVATKAGNFDFDKGSIKKK